MTRVLVVEDEESFSDALSYMLRREGFDAVVAESGPQALAEFDRGRRRHRAARPDAARAAGHRGLPGAAQPQQRADHHADREGRRDRQGRGPGARRRRLRHQAVLGARAGRPHPRGAPPHGGDAARRRPRACSRPGRCGWTSSGTSSSVDGEPVALPLKEFDLLEYLLRNAGRVLTRGQLIDRVWGADYVGDTKTLDVHVKRLRAKLEPDPANAEVPADRARAGLQARGLAALELVDRARGVGPGPVRRLAASLRAVRGTGSFYFWAPVAGSSPGTHSDGSFSAVGSPAWPVFVLDSLMCSILGRPEAFRFPAACSAAAAGPAGGWPDGGRSGPGRGGARSAGVARRRPARPSSAVSSAA